jgi:hypothetical protein
MLESCCSNLDWRDVDRTREHHPDCPTLTVRKNYVLGGSIQLLGVESAFGSSAHSPLPIFEPQTVRIGSPIGSPQWAFRAAHLCRRCNQEYNTLAQFDTRPNQVDCSCPHCGEGLFVRFEY